jgi:hypothetical protein
MMGSWIPVTILMESIPLFCDILILAYIYYRQITKFNNIVNNCYMFRSLSTITVRSHKFHNTYLHIYLFLKSCILVPDDGP